MRDDSCCQDCRFWDEDYDINGKRIGYGDCRRHSPTIQIGIRKAFLKDLEQSPETVNEFLDGHWPLTDACDWCGDWEGR
jgi:hypothetical protein